MPDSTALRVEFPDCPICGRPGADIGSADCTAHALWHEPLPRTLEWRRCQSCAHVYTRYYWTQTGLEEIFRHAHPEQASLGNVEQKVQTWKPVVTNVLGLLGGFRAVQERSRRAGWLDVGCGDGALIMAAVDFGFAAEGVDARSRSVDAVRSLGYPAVQADFLSVGSAAPLAVVSMMDVLEHLPFPDRALRHAHSLLDDDGILIISAPNSDSFAWRLMEQSKQNPYWMEIEHHHNFGFGLLQRLLVAHGFTVALFDIPYRYKAQMEIYAVKSRNRW